MSAALPGILKRRTRRLGIALCLTAFAAAACAPAEEQPDIPVNAQGDLLIQVVDQLYDAGRGASVALNKDGSPAVSYLLYKPVLKAGDIPPAVVPGQPQPPAVILATLAEGVWNRASVTPQINNPAQGDAPELANDEGQAIPGTTTGIAVDAQDKHHLVWSTSKGGLFYADDTAGNFGEAEEITKSPAYGASIALSQSGSPWISFYAGGTVRVAQRTAPGNWTTEDVQRNAGPAAAPATVTAIRVTPSGDPVVAYGDQGRTLVARRSGGTWTTEQVPGDGGYGVSLALDKNGNPSVAFYDTAGNVHVARSSGGGPWDVADLGATGPPKEPPSDIRWATGVAIDDQGTTFVTWADTKVNQIMLAANQGDTPTSQAVAGSANGTNPSLAVSADGKSLALAWFDGSNANLEVAQGPPPSELILAHPLTPAPTPTGGGQPTAPPAECEPDGTTLQIAAQNIAFDKNCLAAPAGEPFTIEFNNQEPIPHNVEISTDSSATTRLGGATGPGDIVTGPTTVTYEVDALEPGTYYFQCDVHAAAMNGTFVVK
jgi:plastocyanin